MIFEKYGIVTLTQKLSDFDLLIQTRMQNKYIISFEKEISRTKVSVYEQNKVLDANYEKKFLFCVEPNIEKLVTKIWEHMPLEMLKTDVREKIADIL